MSLEIISQSRIGWRVKCIESSKNLIIRILTPKRIDFLVFSLIFLGGWGFTFLGQLQFGFDPNFLCVGIIIILFPLYAFLWNIVGKEIITINKEKIIVRQTIFGVGFSQTYQLSQVSNLRSILASPTLFTLESNMQAWGFGGGSIAFDYNERICRFGLMLSKENADELVTKIKKYLAISTNKAE